MARATHKWAFKPGMRAGAYSWKASSKAIERLNGALLDRLTHHVNIREMTGESYRLAKSRARKPGDNNH